MTFCISIEGSHRKAIITIHFSWTMPLLKSSKMVKIMGKNKREMVLFHKLNLWPSWQLMLNHTDLWWLRRNAEKFKLLCSPPTPILYSSTNIPVIISVLFQYLVLTDNSLKYGVFSELTITYRENNGTKGFYVNAARRLL